MKKEYQVSPVSFKRTQRSAVLLIGLSVGMLLVPILIIGSGANVSGAIVLYLLCVVFAAYHIPFALYLLRTLQTRLLISPTHIEFRSVGIELRTEWSNISRIGKVPLPGGKTFDTFVLREPPEQIASWWWYILNGGRLEQQIHLSLFEDWRNTEMVLEVQKYAPHLFK